MLNYKMFSLLPGFETNAYLLWDNLSLEALLIDPASPSDEITQFVSDGSFKVSFIINTHGHADHIAGNGFFKKQLNSKICIHENDAQMLINPKLNLSAYLEVDLLLPEADILLYDNYEFKLGTNSIKVIHTPGHTQGCISLFTGNFLFSGDTLFYHDIGRTDLPGGSQEMIISSIRNKLFLLPDDTIVLPGHGPSSTIADEKNNNPYI